MWSPDLLLLRLSLSWRSHGGAFSHEQGFCVLSHKVPMRGMLLFVVSNGAAVEWSVWFCCGMQAMGHRAFSTDPLAAAGVGN